MTRLSERYNWGEEVSKENPQLYRQLNDVYFDIAKTSNGKSNKNVTTATNPPADDDVNKNFDIGDIWVRTDSNLAWIMTSRTSPTAVNWKAI